MIPELNPLLERHHPTLLIETDGATRRDIVSLMMDLGYQAYMLQAGVEVPLEVDSDKDIIFRFE